ncbi:MAG: hypothetical protein Q9161_003106 [Pseudevernia consocians]
MDIESILTMPSWGDNSHRNLPLGQWNGAVARTTNCGSIEARGIKAELRRLEDDIGSEIRKRLNNIHSGNAELYYRLAPAKAPQGTSQKDSSAFGVAMDGTLGYLSEARVDAAINELVKRMPEDFSNR